MAERAEAETANRAPHGLEHCVAAPSMIWARSRWCSRLTPSTAVPSTTGTTIPRFPHAIDGFLAKAHLAKDTKRKVRWDNCARLYNL